MGWKLPETKLVDLSPAKNRSVEKGYMEFMNLPPEKRTKDTGYVQGNTSYFWDVESQTWKREIEIKPPPPKYTFFIVYGEFSYGPKNLNFYVVRIPGSGTNWHKQIIPELRRISNELTGKKKSRWNVDSYDGIEKTWEKSKLPLRRFYWRGDRLVEKRAI